MSDVERGFPRPHGGDNSEWANSALNAQEQLGFLLPAQFEVTADTISLHHTSQAELATPEQYEPADAFWDAVAAFKDGILPDDAEIIVGNAEARLGYPLEGQRRTDLLSLAEQEINAQQGE